MGLVETLKEGRALVADSLQTFPVTMRFPGKTRRAAKTRSGRSAATPGPRSRYCAHAVGTAAPRSAPTPQLSHIRFSRAATFACHVEQRNVCGFKRLVIYTLRSPITFFFFFKFPIRISQFKENWLAALLPPIPLHPLLSQTSWTSSRSHSAQTLTRRIGAVQSSKQI